MEPGLARNATGPEEFEVTYEQLLAEAQRPCGCLLVLMEISCSAGIGLLNNGSMQAVSEARARCEKIFPCRRFSYRKD
jgi:hypothetical protein